ncbi:MAG: hypothetical protein LAP21_01250 [Acidobacteriia bacterium]|nr:hypothetical protein [Terriglobia bacterium]
MKLSVIEKLSVLTRDAGRGPGRFIFHRILLCAILAISLLTPFLQVDSLDRFPTSTDDIEVHITCCLSILGMLLVFARILKAASAVLRSWLAGGVRVRPGVVVLPFEKPDPEAVFLHRFVPLRI